MIEDQGNLTDQRNNILVQFTTNYDLPETDIRDISMC